MSKPEREEIGRAELVVEVAGGGNGTVDQPAGTSGYDSHYPTDLPKFDGTEFSTNSLCTG